MEKQSFLNNNRPLLCAMVQEKTTESVINKILNCRYDGAEALGIQLECIEKQYRTEKDLKDIFSACAGLPIYCTSYRNYESTGMSDEECAEYLTLAVKCGATLADVMGDMFNKTPEGITFDVAAVQKQKEFIDRLHLLNAEVLMSTHLPHFYGKKDVYAIAQAQQERGADVIKIVNFSNDERELLQNIEICAELKNRITKPYLYLASGNNCRLLRQIGGSLGCCLYLCVERYGGIYSKEQPILRSQKLIKDNMVK